MGFHVDEISKPGIQIFQIVNLLTNHLAHQLHVLHKDRKTWTRQLKCLSVPANGMESRRLSKKESGGGVGGVVVVVVGGGGVVVVGVVVGGGVVVGVVVVVVVVVVVFFCSFFFFLSFGM